MEESMMQKDNENTVPIIQTVQTNVSILQNKVEKLFQDTITAAQWNYFVGEIGDKIEIMKQEIDGLQIDIKNKPDKPWYYDAVVIISLLALVISFVATIFTYWQYQQQEIKDLKSELKDNIERISQIPRDYVAYTQQYTNSIVLTALNGSLQAENAMLARRSFSIAQGLPKYLDSSEYILIGQALYTSNSSEESLMMFDAAVKNAKNGNDMVSALRGKANLEMISGAIDEGRQTYQQALNVFDIFPSSIEFYKNLTTVQTYISWATSEYSIGECIRVNDMLNRAKNILDNIKPAETIALQKKQLELSIQAATTCVQKR